MNELLMNERLMSDFVNGDDNNDADTQQPTLWLDAFHNNNNNDNNDTKQITLWSDAFQDEMGGGWFRHERMNERTND